MIRLLTPQLTLVAGDPEGESYIISQAIEKVVERKSKIEIKLVPTGGTTQNLKMLVEGKAELATAQADVVGEDINVTQSPKAKATKEGKSLSPSCSCIV